MSNDVHTNSNSDISVNSNTINFENKIETEKCAEDETNMSCSTNKIHSELQLQQQEEEESKCYCEKEQPEQITLKESTSYTRGHNSHKEEINKSKSPSNNVTAVNKKTKVETIRIPIVGLLPNRCRADVWFEPQYMPSSSSSANYTNIPDNQHYSNNYNNINNNNNNSNNNSSNNISNNNNNIG